MRRSTVFLFLIACALPLHTLSEQRDVGPPEHSFRNFFVFNEGKQCSSRMDDADVKVVLRAGSDDQLLWQFSSICDRRVKVVARPKDEKKDVLRCTSSDKIQMKRKFPLSFGDSKSLLCRVPVKPASPPPYLYEVAYCLIPANEDDCTPKIQKVHELEIEVPARVP